MPAFPLRLQSEVLMLGRSSVGAGDTFIAGMLYGLTERWHDWGFQHSLAFAIKLAGEKVGQEGFDGLRDKVERHLAPEAPLD